MRSRYKKYAAILVAFIIILLGATLMPEFRFSAVEDERESNEEPIMEAALDGEEEPEVGLVELIKEKTVGSVTISAKDDGFLPDGFDFTVEEVNYSDTYELAKNTFENQNREYDFIEATFIEVELLANDNQVEMGTYAVSLLTDSYMEDATAFYKLYLISADHLSIAETSSCFDENFSEESCFILALVRGDKVENNQINYSSNGVTMSSSAGLGYDVVYSVEKRNDNDLPSLAMTTFNNQNADYLYSAATSFHIKASQLDDSLLGLDVELTFNTMTSGDLVVLYYMGTDKKICELAGTFENGDVISVKTNVFKSVSECFYTVVYGTKKTEDSEHFYLAVGEDVDVYVGDSGSNIVEGEDCIKINATGSFVKVTALKEGQGRFTWERDGITKVFSFTVLPGVSFTDENGNKLESVTLNLGQTAKIIPSITGGEWNSYEDTVVRITKETDGSYSILGISSGITTVTYKVKSTSGSVEKEYSVSLDIIVQSDYVVKYVINGDKDNSFNTSEDRCYSDSTAKETAKAFEGYTCVGYGFNVNEESFSNRGDSLRVNSTIKAVVFYYCKNVTVTVKDQELVYDGTAFTAFDIEPVEAENGENITFSSLSYAYRVNDKKVTEVKKCATYSVSLAAKCIGTISDEGKYIISTVNAGTVVVKPSYLVNFYQNNKDKSQAPVGIGVESYRQAIVNGEINLAIRDIAGYSFARCSYEIDGTRYDVDYNSEGGLIHLVANTNVVINLYYYKNIELRVKCTNEDYYYCGKVFAAYSEETVGDDGDALFDSLTYVVRDSEDKDVTATVKNVGNYTVTIEPEGTLISTNGKYLVTRITPASLEIKKVKLVIESNSYSKTYDGERLYPEEDDFVIYKLGDESKTPFVFPANETITVYSDGKYALNPNSANPVSNSFTCNYSKINPNNYEITKKYGLLTVYRDNTNHNTIVVKAKSETVTYDGVEHTLEGIESGDGIITDGGVDYRVEAETIPVSLTKVGEVELRVGQIKVFINDTNEDVSQEFNFERESGLLKVVPIDITLRSSDVVFTSNGDLIDGSQTVEIVEGQLLTGDYFGEDSFVFAGGSTQAGNVFTYQFERVEDADGYNITCEYGNYQIRYMHKVSYCAVGDVVPFEKEEDFYIPLGEESVEVAKKDFEGRTYAYCVLNKTVEKNKKASILLGNSRSDIVFYYYTNVEVAPSRISCEYSGSRITPECTYECLYKDALFDGLTYTINDNDAAIATGKYKIVIDDSAIGIISKNEKYIITSLAEGEFEILKKKISLMSSDVTLDSDGNILDGEFKVEVESGLISGDELEFSFLAGSPEIGNYFTYRWKDPSTQANYEITDVNYGSYVVKQLYNFTICYVDEDNNQLAENFTVKLLEGKTFGPVISPKVDGYSAKFEQIYLAEPITEDVLVSVVYKKDLVEPEETPEDKPETSPEETPEETPEVRPEETPEETPEVKPEETPEETPEVKPEEKPEEAPEVKPEETPEETPEVKPEETPEVEPEETPEETPEVKPEETPEETPEVKPEEKPEESLEQKPDTTPEEMPEEIPDTKPESKPQTKPQSKPQTPSEEEISEEVPSNDFSGEYDEVTSTEVEPSTGYVVNDGKQYVINEFKPGQEEGSESEKSSAKKDKQTSKKTVIASEPAAAELPENHWAIINLIALIITFILSIIGFVTGRNNGRFVVSIPGIVALMTFYYTEGLARSFVVYDRWTWLMLVILLAEIIIFVITRKKNKGDEKCLS